MPDHGVIIGEIKVASQIVDYLSSGLYHNPAACMKELINNSYDADATEVNIFIKPDADRVIIEDDGVGMSLKEFQNHFERVADSSKRASGETTSSGRPKIGKIGIGFIAANEICDVMEIYTTKANSTELLHVEIDFSIMRDPSAQRRDENGVKKGDYKAWVSETDRDEHYMQIFLKGIRPAARRDLVERGNIKADTGHESLYGLTETGVHSRLNAPSKQTSWADRYDAYSTTMLQIALNTPVKYHDAWIAPRHNSAVGRIVKSVEELGFKVTYDGVDLRKPIVFKSQPGAASISQPFSYEGEEVSFTGYFYAQRTALRPLDLTGVLVRIRNSAVGQYRRDFLSYPSSKAALFKTWTSSEIYADDRLEQALNIDRRTLRDTHPAVVELTNVYHSLLAEFLGRVRTELYTAQARERKEVVIAESTREIAGIVRESTKNLPSSVTDRLTEQVSELGEQRGTKSLARKFTAVQIYSIAVAAAEAVLPPEGVAEFISELNRRLAK